MAVPNKREEEKANREGRKSPHGVDEVGVISGHVERDDEKSKRKAEDSVAESLKTGDFESALAEAVDIFPYRVFPAAARNMSVSYARQHHGTSISSVGNQRRYRLCSVARSV